jgi:hypothetical protein
MVGTVLALNFLLEYRKNTKEDIQVGLNFPREFDSGTSKRRRLVL